MTYGNRSAHNPERGMDEMVLVVKQQCAVKLADGSILRPGQPIEPDTDVAKANMRKLRWERRALVEFVANREERADAKVSETEEAAE